MSRVIVTDIQVLDNPCKFTENFKFQVTFDCVAPGLQGELEWKLVYVGSADDKQHDQLLDSVLVGPLQVGRNSFVFEAPAPDWKLIPAKDLLEVTVVLLTCSYMDREFVRVGYYVNNYFATPELQQNPPAHHQLDINTICRNLAHDQPRVTRLHISWDPDVSSDQNFQMSVEDQARAAAAPDEHPEVLQEEDKDEGMTAFDVEDEEDGDENSFLPEDNSFLQQRGLGGGAPLQQQQQQQQQRQRQLQQQNGRGGGGGMEMDVGHSVDAFKDPIDLSIR